MSHCHWQLVILGEMELEGTESSAFHTLRSCSPSGSPRAEGHPWGCSFCHPGSEETGNFTTICVRRFKTLKQETNSNSCYWTGQREARNPGISKPLCALLRSRRQTQWGIMAQRRWQLGHPESLALFGRALPVFARYFYPRGDRKSVV